MEQWKEYQLKQLTLTTDIRTAYELSLAFINSIGFKFCAFSTSYLESKASAQLTGFDNYPTSWNCRCDKERTDECDPIVAYCNHTMLPIVWTEELFSRSPWIWDALEYHGLQHGWSQSFIDEENGLCSTLSLARPHCPITAFELYENVGFSMLIGRHLHSLVTQTCPRQSKPSLPHLSDREIEVLRLAAAGKTAGETAQILNVTARTVNFHVQAAMAKLGVNNKISAVIAAITAGFLAPSAVR
jgi:DNA-binding CsgD family transcriptional regulator